MNRAEDSLVIELDCFQRIKIRCYKMYRAAASTKRKSSIGTTDIVAMDFNPLA